MELKIKEIIESLGDSSGQEYFDKIVIALALVIDVEYVFIALLDDENDTSKTLSVSSNHKIVDNFEYELEGTPCANVKKGSLCCYPRNITELFPKDQLLIDMKIESYIGSPLRNSAGKVIGLLVALSEKPIENDELISTLFTLFSDRTSVEIERTSLEAKNKEFIKSLKEMNKSLEEKVSKQVEEKILQEKILLQQSRKAQMGEMISMITHQWKQPLSCLSSSIIALQMRKSLCETDLITKDVQEEFSEFLDGSLSSMQDLVQRLNTTIDDFKDFYNPNKKVIITTFEDLVNKSISIVKSSLINSKVDIRYEYNSNEEVKVYDSEMIHVILNIIKNSQDNFLEKNIQNPTITIFTNDRKLTICDNGGGIEDDIINKVFEQYFSSKESEGGSGLGLYMSKKIVEEHHNGKFTVKNIDDGACFSIELE